jgi:predicted MPP superfamily phosphohydrolase
MKKENMAPNVNVWKILGTGVYSFMRRIIQFTIFFSMFFSFTLLFQYYIFLHMSYMLQIPHTIWFWLFLVASSAWFFLAYAMQAVSDNFVTRGFFTFTAVWLGTIFIILFILLPYDILRFIFDLDPYIAGRFITGLVLIMVVFGIFNSKFIRQREVVIKAKGHGKGNLKIAHLSDFHLGAVYNTKFLQKVVDKTNALHPDLVLITGDLVDGPYDYTPDTFAPLNDIKAPVFFTTGNHEYFTELDEILELLGRTKVRILRNETVNVGNVQIVGIDNTHRELFGEVLSGLKIDPNKFTILMHHRPIGLETANRYGVNLMLSGHTHGGQFFPFIFFAKIIWRRARGVYKFKNTYLNTSTGIGTWGPPLRIGSNSEIVLVRVVEN